MSQQPVPQQGPTAQQLLAKIEMHLKKIRSMMEFFVVVVILAIIIQACSAIVGL